MKFPPVYIQTEHIKKLLYDLDVLKAAYELHPVANEIVSIKRNASILKSALFSARIEGNPMTIDEARLMDLQEPTTVVHKREIMNLAALYEDVAARSRQTMTVDFLKELHARVLDGIFSRAGRLRLEESAIWNQAGVAVYLTPSPQKILGLLEDLLQWISASTNHPCIVAAVAHIWFEKIHPFDDGNGRVGRFLSACILYAGGFGFGGMVPIEEYLEAHRDEYYRGLARDMQDVTPFVEFFLEGITEQVRISLKETENVIETDTMNLLPRRAEIVAIIRDHKSVSFDFLVRRFRSIPSRTLHNDVAQIIKAGYIRKRGATRGARYEPVEKKYG